jgi:hypothetical protein
MLNITDIKELSFTARIRSTKYGPLTSYQLLLRDNYHHQMAKISINLWRKADIHDLIKILTDKNNDIVFVSPNIFDVYKNQ